MAQVGDVFNQVLRFRDDLARFSMPGVLHQDSTRRVCLSKIFHSRSISIRFSMSGMFLVKKMFHVGDISARYFFFLSEIFLQDGLYRGYFFKIFHVGDVSVRFFHSGMFLQMYIAGDVSKIFFSCQ